MAAASGTGMDTGMGKVMVDGATTSSAYPPCAPLGMATTRVPTIVASTPAPTDSTEPSTSIPGMYGAGTGTVR